VSRRRGIFVVGTDTEVGKTVFCAAVVAALRQDGRDAGYCKPVSSDGVAHGGRLVSPDALLVAEATGLDDPPELLNPVCLPHPLSPLAAARRAGTGVDLAAALAGARACVAAHDFTVVEGVGGLLVPLTDDHTLRELVRESTLPAVVVGRPNLGTINHTLLTIEALRAAGVPVRAFAFSGPRPQAAGDPALESNAALIQEFSGAPFAGRLPWLDQAPSARSLAAAAESLDLALLTAG